MAPRMSPYFGPFERSAAYQLVMAAGGAGGAPELPQVLVYGRGDKVPPGYRKINATSRSKDEFRAFSPFRLGPIRATFVPDAIDAGGGELFEVVVPVFENFWQYSKRYATHASWTDWRRWAEPGLLKGVADRFPMGRGAKPEYSYHVSGKRPSYVEARFHVYAPNYENLVLRYARPQFDALRAAVDRGEKIAIFDFDGHVGAVLQTEPDRSVTGSHVDVPSEHRRSAPSKFPAI